VLQLRKEDPKVVINKAVEQMSLRARVRDIALEYKAPDNLPAVAMDRVSVQEVMSNLIDNAIKYSKDSKKIVITSVLTKENLVETSVQDWGVGINSAIIDNLFSKFYRDHRNRAQIGGTGLGLYLSKAIVRAHGGNIWVRSKEGQGSVFSVTLQPHDSLSAEQKTGGDITRSAHGWIKNHSLYRR
jgi:signal transduction histidine kinase